MSEKYYFPENKWVKILKYDEYYVLEFTYYSYRLNYALYYSMAKM